MERAADELDELISDAPNPPKRDLFAHLERGSIRFKLKSFKFWDILNAFRRRGR